MIGVNYSVIHCLTFTQLHIFEEFAHPRYRTVYFPTSLAHTHAHRSGFPSKLLSIFWYPPLRFLLLPQYNRSDWAAEVQWNNTNTTFLLLSLFVSLLLSVSSSLHKSRASLRKDNRRGCVGMSLQLQQGNILMNWTVKSIVTPLGKKKSSNCNYVDVEPKGILGFGKTDKTLISFLFTSLFICPSFLCGLPSFNWIVSLFISICLAISLASQARALACCVSLVYS